MSDAERTSNWGRWGDFDERGTANLLTDETRLEALSIPKQGRVLQLAHLVGDPASPAMDQRRPLHLMTHLEPEANGDMFATDYLAMYVHGSATHIDALGHHWTGDEIYNGVNPRDAHKRAGLLRAGIDKTPALIARGVLADVAGVRGVDHLPDSHEVSVADLETALAAADSDLGPGDVILIRTGWGTVFSIDPARYFAAPPGLGTEAAGWLAARDVLAVGADNNGLGTKAQMRPVHRILLRDFGVHIMEFVVLDELADEKPSEFLFVALPLRISGGTGSLITPLAVL